ncbi:hypothetical protein UCRPC4_g04224 [Phaeomoniella chlamydospora]|uniref:Spindle pole body-associated protein cut12 domain-containing protein n=1 Tax=Phaeomoniella chlamydospora TaxID=158046 RepID=A0A0G2EAT9_PHACM|nr:hypothetical protein UCRPC4_g04224 [Phaeomoniella chlamydospora]
MVAFRDAPSRKLAADKSPANKEQLKKEEGLAQRRSDAAAGVESQSSPLRSTSRSPLKDIETQVSPSPKQRTSKLRHVQSPASTTKEHPRSRTSREATRAQAPCSPLPSRVRDKTSVLPPPPTTSTEPTITSSKSHSYRTHSDRQLRKLLRRYDLVKSYARMKDEEANEMSLRVKQLEEENRNLLKELQQLKDSVALKSGDLEIPNPPRTKETRNRIPETRWKFTGPTTGTINSTETTRRQHLLNQTHPFNKLSDKPTTDLQEKSLPLDFDFDTPAAAAAAAATTTTTATALSAKVPNLPPDRLAAARARLKLKAEERRKRGGREDE